MIAFAAPLIALQLLFPMFSLILLASYFKEAVIVCIAIIILANLVVLKSKCLKQKLYCYIGVFYGLEDEEIKKGQKVSEEIFFTAILTSWISPSTLWSHNFKFKSYFLIVSSLTTLIAYAVGIIFVFFFTYYEVFKLDLLQTENPPITHCFKNEENDSLR